MTISVTRKLPHTKLPENKPIHIAIDFDGPIHRYRPHARNKGPFAILDTSVPGVISRIQAWLDNGYTVTILTARLTLADAKGRYAHCHQAITQWLINEGLEREDLELINITNVKPAADIYIDDKAYTFDSVLPSEQVILRFIRDKKL